MSIVHKNKFDDSLFKKIRVENALSDFNKGILRDILSSIDNFKNYVLDNELISAAVFSTVNLDHLSENLKACDITMPEKIRKEIKKRA